jgi:transposase
MPIASHLETASISYLPTCNPDLNPIKLTFNKLKGLLPSAAERTIDAPWPSSDS